ncbi:MAG: hypothetical protein IT249_05980 [Chitinophagaceae bacterium]|nr:hypothetical protein [Chitinophagaceae bacterium]
MIKFLRNNALSVFFLLLFIVCIAGQFFTGFAEHNKERKDDGMPELSMPEYIQSGHFIQATFENWESEFLQMALFVVITIWLKQKGSSESKSLNDKEAVDREPDPQRKDAPYAVRKGGWLLVIYKHSLTLALLLLFIISFIIHFYGSLKDENEQLLLKGKPLQSIGKYMLDSRFWFESFQNWQSEFLSVFAIVVLSIFLRQKGSPQSKPVDAPNAGTGGE